MIACEDKLVVVPQLPIEIDGNALMTSQLFSLPPPQSPPCNKHRHFLHLRFGFSLQSQHPALSLLFGILLQCLQAPQQGKPSFLPSSTGGPGAAVVATQWSPSGAASSSLHFNSITVRFRFSSFAVQFRFSSIRFPLQRSFIAVQFRCNCCS